VVSQKPRDVDFTVAAFNAHWGVGRFGSFRHVKYDVARVVRSFNADLVVVAEAWRSDDGCGVLDALSEDGYQVETIAFMRLELRHDRNLDVVPHEGMWELAVCSRFPVLDRRVIPLGTLKSDPPGPRSALALTVDIDGAPTQVMGVHTSSKVWRLAPVRHLVALKRGLAAGGPQIIAGDLNFWGPPVGALFRGWKRPVRGRTYPANRPHSQIDHVLVRGGVDAVAGEVLAATPSDHRPIRARLRMSREVS
jgi:endonuclease/exonuclease/phosphatase family metal-dependent hydrolase